MPVIDISHVDWAEVGPDLYLALLDLRNELQVWASIGGTRRPVWTESRIRRINEALARVEGKE